MLRVNYFFIFKIIDFSNVYSAKDFVLKNLSIQLRKQAPRTNIPEIICRLCQKTKDEFNHLGPKINIKYNQSVYLDCLIDFFKFKNSSFRKIPLIFLH